MEDIWEHNTSSFQDRESHLRKRHFPIPGPPKGRSLTLLEDPTGRFAVGTTGAVLWPAATALVEYLDGQVKKSCLNFRCVELGAGVGAVGLFMALHKGCEVTLTEVPEQLQLLGLNVSENSPTGLDLQVAPLTWGDQEQMEVLGTFEMVVGSDVSYRPQCIGELLSTAERLLAPGGRVVFSLQDRPGEADLLESSLKSLAVSKRQSVMAKSLEGEEDARNSAILGLAFDSSSPGFEAITTPAELLRAFKRYQPLFFPRATTAHPSAVSAGLVVNVEDSTADLALGVNESYTLESEVKAVHGINGTVSKKDPGSDTQNSSAPGGLLIKQEVQAQLQKADLSEYFVGRYLDGEVFEKDSYEKGQIEAGLPIYKFEGADGPTFVWQFAFDLRGFGQKGENIRVLYHYSNELAFLNVGNSQLSAAEIFASLVDERAHFGKGVYATQHEPAVWASRVRILLNNYSNEDPLRRDTSDEESRRVEKEWGDGNTTGHRAQFCVPLIVPDSIAYNIFEKQTPDMKAKRVTDKSGKERPLALGEDYKGRAVHRNRDVWVVRLASEGGIVQHATAEAEGLIQLLQLRLSKLRGRLGNEDCATLDCMDQLADRLNGRGRHSEAEELRRQALEKRQDKFGKDHEQTLISLTNLATCLNFLGRAAEAEPLSRDAWQKSQKKLGANHKLTRKILDSLAHTLYSQGKYQEAESRWRENWEKCKDELGSDHLETLSILNDLAGALKEQGKLDDAERFHREVLQKRRVKLGAKHPLTLISLNNLATLLVEQKKPAEAEPLFRESLQTRQEKLGAHHEDSLGALQNLAGVLQEQGNMKEAEALFREALQTCQEKLTTDHLSTLTTRNNLATLLAEQGRNREAEPLYREVLQKRRERLGRDHPDTLGTLMSLVTSMLHLEKFGEVEPFCREALQISQEKLGDDHPHTLICLNSLGGVMQSQGKLREAEELFKAAWMKSREMLGDQHPTTQTFYNNWVRLGGPSMQQPSPQLFAAENRDPLGIAGASGLSQGRMAEIDAEIERVLLGEDSDEELEAALRTSEADLIRAMAGNNAHFMGGGLF
ncbi:Nphp3 [Symbiodinium necroappetens]|uniref:Nphp3 protein n=1 Tax=Symbiodinium necroappetens TaxID=1628268 RepID=A0A812NRH5_9DINO|nr:Nphp3 [Symbiodinium necroappetens]